MKTPSARRRRLRSEESRDAALDAARGLLIEAGPQAVTLKAVAARVGRTHANLLHHFGSAAGLQEALVVQMAGAIAERVRTAVVHAREIKDPAEVVDITFDAFGTGGAGALVTWLILNGSGEALAPILVALHDLVEDLAGPGIPPLSEETLQIVLMALSDGLLGAPVASALGLERGTARRLAREIILKARAGMF